MSLSIIRHLEGFKIVMDVLQDDPSATLTKTPDEPFGRILITLARIACPASRQYVFRRVCAATVNRDKVLLYQNSRIIPQLGRIATVGTCAMPVMDSVQPVLQSESERQISFPGASSLLFLAVGFRVLELAFAISFLYTIRVSLPVSKLFSLFLLKMCTPIISVAFTRLLDISMAIAPVTFIYLVAVLRMILPGQCAFDQAMFRVVLPFYLIFTESTGRVKPVFGVMRRVKILSGCGIPATTLRAAFKGERIVDHSVSLSLYHKWLSADGVICRRFGFRSYPNLADSEIILRYGLARQGNA